YGDADPELRRVHFLDDGQRGWALSRYTILYTADGGGNWQKQLDVPAGEFRFADFRFEATEEGVRGWVVGDSAIFRTVGETLHPLIESYRIKSDVGRVELQWRLKDEPADKVKWKPEDIFWTITY